MVSTDRQRNHWGGFGIHHGAAPLLIDMMRYAHLRVGGTLGAPDAGMGPQSIRPGGDPMLPRTSQTLRTARAVTCALLVMPLMVGCPRHGTDSPGAHSSEAQPEYKTLGEALKSARRPESWEMVLTTPEGKEVGRQLVCYERGLPRRAVLSEENHRLYIFFDRQIQVRYTPSDKGCVAAPTITFDGMGDVPPADAGLYAPESLITGVEMVDGVECWMATGAIGRRNPLVILAIDKSTGLVRELASIRGRLTVTTQRINRIRPQEFELPEGAELPPLSSEPASRPGR